MTLGMTLCSLNAVPIVRANDDLIEPYATEVCTYKKTVGLGDPGYVIVILTLNYIMNTKKYVVAGVNIETHFSSVYPLAKIVGTPTVNPAIGKTLTGNTVRVTFQYTTMPISYGLIGAKEVEFNI